jgi:hypothetical protein
MDSAAWGLIGTLVGALASIGTTWLSSWNSHRLQEKKTKEERLERANAFQRETLIDLQDAIHNSLRLMTRAHIEDQKAHRQGSKWGTNLLGSELNEEIRLGNRRVAILVERVTDDALRTEVKALMSTASELALARSEADAKAASNGLTFKGATVLEQIGSVLRRHY